MAERYDPKLSVRPLSERKPASPASAGEDPLVELARIVSGRSTFDPGPAARTKTVPVNGAVASDVALANDLESELMNDLQASFSSTFYAPPPPPPPPAPAAAKPAAPATKPAAAPAPKPAAAAPAAAPAVPAASPPSLTEKPAAKLERPPLAAPSRPEKPATAPAVMAPRNERQAGAVTAPAERPPATRQVGVAAEKPEKSELADAQLRPTNAAHPAPADVATPKPSGRWERPAEPRAVLEPSRFAPPPRGAALFRPKAPVPEPEPPEDEPPDLTAFGEAASEEDGYEEETLGPEDLDALPIYGEDELPPFPDELEELDRRRPRRGLFIGGAALALVLAAGVAYVLLRSESSVATPPIITADATPAKIVPAATPASNDEQNKLIYDRVNGGQSADGTKLVTPGDDKVAAAPAASADENNPISRVIAPGGPGFDPPPKAGDAAAASGDQPADTPAASDGDSGQISPKKVRTVVVRPDMTVVSSRAASADDSGKLPAGASPAVPPTAGPAADANADVPSKTTQMDAVVDNGKGLPIPVNADPLAANGGGDNGGGGATPADAAPAAAGAAAPGSVPAGDAGSAAPASANGAAAAGDASAAPAAAARPPTPPAKPADKPVVLASRGPIDLIPAKAGKAAAASAAAAQSGGVFVQVSAQKSEDAAKSTYRGLQVKFPSILGNLGPDIQRADLGDKGVYYRVRIGPFASADAQKICGNYKAAGGDCIIAH